MDNVVSLKHYKFTKALDEWLKVSLAVAAAQSQGYVFYANQNRQPKDAS